MKTSKLEQKLNALQNRLNRYISKSVKATRQMILDLIFAISRLERMIEMLEEKQVVPSILDGKPAYQGCTSYKDKYGYAYWVAQQILKGFERRALIEQLKKDAINIKFWHDFEELVDSALAELSNDHALDYLLSLTKDNKKVIQQEKTIQEEIFEYETEFIFKNK